ncbi:MAG: hypothetical protein V3S69_02930 [Dehalococcoidales bacterium]
MCEDRQITFDDMEPVLSEEQVEETEFNTNRKNTGRGMRMYERIQERKELELINDPYPF